jgi:catechol 2,3-dioxygenase-like lactoylglutathione lyase family enzyme
MIGVKDLARSKKFYGDGLGCTIDQDHPNFVSFNLGDGSSSLASTSGTQRPKTPLCPLRVPASGRVVRSHRPVERSCRRGHRIIAKVRRGRPPLHQVKTVTRHGLASNSWKLHDVSGTSQVPDKFID